MAAGAVVFDDVAAALTDRAARELYGAASDDPDQLDVAIAERTSPAGAVAATAT